MKNNKYLFEKLAKLVYNSGWEFDAIIYLDSISGLYAITDDNIFSKLFNKPLFSEKELDREIRGKVLLLDYIVNKYEDIKKYMKKAMKKIMKNKLISEIRSAVIWDYSGKYIMFGNIPKGPFCGEKI
jgi:hypothetical protein